MSDNTGILQVPITAKSSETINNDIQKLVYVHIPKDKVSLFNLWENKFNKKNIEYYSIYIYKNIQICKFKK